MELVKGLGRFFTQPLLYIAIIFVWILSIRRIKKERAEFGIRIFNPFSEWKGTWGVSLLAGAVLTVISVGGGVVVTYPLLWLVSLVTFAVCLTLGLRWFSSVYTLGLSCLILLIIPYLPENLRTGTWIASLAHTPLLSTTILLSLLLFVEAVLLLRTSSRQTFPERRKGSRGMWVGQHRSRQMAVVPFIALLPAGAIEPFASWWPLIQIGESSFGLIMVPLLTGWEWVARGQSPVKAAKLIGRHTFLLAVIVFALSITSFYISYLSLVAVVISLLGRELIYLMHRIRESQKPFFSTEEQGLRILGVIPGSPAAEMGLLPGELIVRVNSTPVDTENQLYEALQNNGAFSKIEVRDERGENRYTQRAIYEGEHYELGLVFIEPPTHEKSVGFFGL